MGCTATGSPLAAINWAVLARRLHASPQQMQLVQLIVTQDLTDDALAAALGCSVHAVRTQLDRLRHKLGVHSRAAIVARAWEAWMAGERDARRSIRKERG